MADFPRLGALIFGEGVLNDALSIVIFKALLSAFVVQQQEEEQRQQQHGGHGGAVVDGSQQEDRSSLNAGALFGNVVMQLLSSAKTPLWCQR